MLLTLSACHYLDELAYHKTESNPRITQPLRDYCHYGIGRCQNVREKKKHRSTKHFETECKFKCASSRALKYDGANWKEMHIC